MEMSQKPSIMDNFRSQRRPKAQIWVILYRLMEAMKTSTIPCVIEESSNKTKVTLEFYSENNKKKHSPAKYQRDAMRKRDYLRKRKTSAEGMITPGFECDAAIPPGRVMKTGTPLITTIPSSVMGLATPKHTKSRIEPQEPIPCREIRTMKTLKFEAINISESAQCEGVKEEPLVQGREQDFPQDNVVNTEDLPQGEATSDTPENFRSERHLVDGDDHSPGSIDILNSEQLLIHGLLDARTKALSKLDSETIKGIQLVNPNMAKPKETIEALLEEAVMILKLVMEKHERIKQEYDSKKKELSDYCSSAPNITSAHNERHTTISPEVKDGEVEEAIISKPGWNNYKKKKKKNTLQMFNKGF